jgi:hypothetical protein
VIRGQSVNLFPELQIALCGVANSARGHGRFWLALTVLNASHQLRDVRNRWSLRRRILIVVTFEQGRARRAAEAATWQTANGAEDSDRLRSALLSVLDGCGTDLALADLPAL